MTPNKKIKQLMTELTVIMTNDFEKILDNQIGKSEKLYKLLTNFNNYMGTLYDLMTKLESALTKIDYNLSVLNANIHRTYKPTLIEIANESIHELELTRRTVNCLQARDIQTIAQLCTYSCSDLLKTANLGPKSLQEIQTALALKGLKLAE